MRDCSSAATTASAYMLSSSATCCISIAEHIEETLTDVVEVMGKCDLFLLFVFLPCLSVSVTTGDRDVEFCLKAVAACWLPGWCVA